ncbi:MAG: TRAP transporter permease, partial [Candidatus Rokuibacteriota bacterium]
SGWAGRTASGVLVAASLFHLYVAGYGAVSAMSLRTVHWTLLSVAVFLLYRARRAGRTRAATWADALWAAAALVSGGYIFWVWPDRMFLLSALTPLDRAMGLVMVVVVLEGARRSLGTLLPAVSFMFLGYASFGPWMPGWLAHKGYGIDRIVEELYITTGGIYGIPIAVSATYILLFVLFGAFLTMSGGGKMVIDVAHAVAGRFRGGPAKTAVVSSALMGMISGSPVANVVTTGTFTIPLMKRTGYTAVQAGAIEACASTGGMFTPPIMGAAAFIIAEFMGVPYLRVMVAAAIPAFLFYLAVFLFVDLEAVKRGLRGLPREQLPPLRAALRGRLHVIVPLVVLVAALVIGYSPMKSAFWSILLIVALGLPRRATRLGLGKLYAALEAGAANTLSVAAACACAGIIVGVVGLTGVGVKFSSVLLQITEHAAAAAPLFETFGVPPVLAVDASVFLTSLAALTLGAVAALVLGCGMPPTAVYIILASLTIPAMKTALEPINTVNAELAAHFFAFHFSTIAAITPPVALAAYAAASLSGGDPFRTGLTACKVGLVGFIVPYMFAYSPELLFEGAWTAILGAVLTASIGVGCLAVGTHGFLRRPLAGWARVAFVLSGLLLIKPGLWTDLLGFGLALLALTLGGRRGTVPVASPSSTTLPT